MTTITAMKKVLREYLCDGVTLLSSAFSFAGRVTEGEDDWPLIEGSHVCDDLHSEGSGNGCHT